MRKQSHGSLAQTAFHEIVLQVEVPPGGRWKPDEPSLEEAGAGVGRHALRRRGGRRPTTISGAAKGLLVQGHQKSALNPKQGAGKGLTPALGVLVIRKQITTRSCLS